MKLSERAIETRRRRDEKDDEYRTGWEELMARDTVVTASDSPEASTDP